MTSAVSQSVSLANTVSRLTLSVYGLLPFSFQSRLSSSVHSVIYIQTMGIISQVESNRAAIIVIVVMKHVEKLTP